MTTANELILSSMRLIGVVATGETPSADEEATALDALNIMIDAWCLEDLFLFRIVENTFSLTSTVSTYTIGTGGTFNTTRPIEIISAFIRQSNVDYDVFINSKQRFDQLTQKNITSTLVTELYYDPAMPLGTINVYPVPSNTQSLHISSKQQLTQITAPDDDIVVPPGYLRALKYSLAIEIAPEFGVQVTQDIAMIAASAKAHIKRKNIQKNTMSYDAELIGYGSSNILTGE